VDLIGSMFDLGIRRDKNIDNKIVKDDVALRCG
jgi:hypothetical protein